MKLNLEPLHAEPLHAQHLLDRGELVEVMPAYSAGSVAVSAVCPHRKQRSQRLAAFIEWFQDLIQPHLAS